ncbi:SAPS-domain-containing protein [Wallemia mellicola]|nr:hypothetical protein E3Q24_00785 [Wallemia mellicola]TIB91028.1 SAPS-domain-containing protein [Wallemia mellicola]TIB92778.1 SAPS-domain-containing protein [Wallemia mellicola]TIC16600.1 SAPS-domain-containing protein [Wallemia mellicola]TIC25478.1 SAPS-domain-containing protein [Wallemia mellicola]
MYWRLGFGANKEIDQLLDKENVELEEILQEDSIIHESKSHNYRLLEFLVLPQNLRKLLGYSNGKINVVDDQYKLRIRFPYVATEILSSDIPAIHEALVDKEKRSDYLQPFWDFIINKSTEDLSQLNPFVGYWGRIVARLLDKKSDEMLDFLKSQNDPITSFLKHIETPVIGDLLFRLIVSDQQDSSVVDFFTESDFIPKLSNILSPSFSNDAHLAVADLLKTVITFSAPSPPTANPDNQIYISNNFARQLGSENVIEKLISYILDDIPIDKSLKDGDISTNHLPDVENNDKIASVTSSLISILSVYIELIRKNNADFSEPHLFHTLRNKLINIQQSQQDDILNSENLDESDEQKEEENKLHLEEAMNKMSQSIGIVHLGSILKSFTKRLGDFQTLLAFPRSYKGPIQSSMGPIKPLTFERFRICELYAELLHCSNMGIFNRNTTVGPYYDNYGRLIGGLDALTQLARALSDSEEMEDIPVNSPEDHIEPQQEQLPQSMSNLSLKVDELTLGDSLKKAMIDNGILKTLVDLFFDYPSNPFLHNVVYDVILQILNGQMDRGLSFDLALSLFNDANLIQKLLDGHDKIKQSEINKTIKPGYSGHVMLIADECVKALEKYDNLHQHVKNKIPDEWNEFVQGPLKTTQEIEKEPLGGIKPQQSQYGHFGKVEGDQDDSDSDDDIGFMSSGFGSTYRSLSGQSHTNINFDEDEDEDDSFFNSFSFKSASFGQPSFDEEEIGDDSQKSQLSKYMNRSSLDDDSSNDEDDFGDFASASSYQYFNDDGKEEIDPFGVSKAGSNTENQFLDNFTPKLTNQNLTPADWCREFKDSVDDESTITIPTLDEGDSEINDAIKGLKIDGVSDERNAADELNFDKSAPLGPGSNGPAEVTDGSVKREVEGSIMEAPKDDLVLLAEEKAKNEY